MRVQKTDMIDKTDIFNATKAYDHVDAVDPIDKTDTINVNKTAGSVDPDGPDDVLQPNSCSDRDHDGDPEERAAIQEFDGESDQESIT